MTSPKVSFCVGGQVFSIRQELLNSGPNTRLSSLATNDDNPVEIDRPRDCFGAILNWYVTGELHIPANVCPGEFKKELEYWKVDAHYLSECCYFRYQSFLEEQDTLRNFRKRAFNEKSSKPTPGLIRKLRSKIWSIIDYREKSLVSKIYFVACLLMVILSILTLGLSTDRSFQRTMTNCERLEYMESTKMADIQLFQEFLGHSCEGEELPVLPSQKHREGQTAPLESSHSPFPVNDEEYDDTFEFIQVFLAPPKSSKPPEPSSDGLGKDLNRATDHLVDGERNKSALVGDIGPGVKLIKVPNMKVPIYAMFILDIVTLVFFTIDLTLRLSTCPSLIGYFKSVVNILDSAALLCTYFHYLATFLTKHDLYQDGWINLLEYVQILRALRLLRVVKNVRASRVLVYSFRQNLRDLSIICIYIVLCTCVFGSVFYIAEGKTNVQGMPRAWYFTIVTLTTLGYGDITPSSTLGKVISGLCVISGLLLFAFTIPILANNFLTLYKYAYMEQRQIGEVKSERENHKSEKKNGLDSAPLKSCA